MKYIYATAANGLEVRIPEAKYEKWKKYQDSIPADEVARSKAAIAQLKAKAKK